MALPETPAIPPVVPGSHPLKWVMSVADGIKVALELPTVQAATRRDMGPPAWAGGTELTLQVTPGPHGNGAWDWSYLSSMIIR